MNRPTITLDDLRAKGACADQAAEFERLFGQSVTVTVAKARKVAQVFDWNWAADAFLKAPALAEYARATAPAFASAYIAQWKAEKAA